MILPSSVHRTRPKLAHFTSVKSSQHNAAHGILTLRKPLHTFGEYLQRSLLDIDAETSEVFTVAWYGSETWKVPPPQIAIPATKPE